MFSAEQYWEKRLGRLTNLEGVGCEGRSAAWNRTLYRTKIRALKRVIKRLGLDVADRSALDVGCGVGFWIDILRGLEASPIVGVDIAASAVNHCRKRFASIEGVTFLRRDIGSTEFDVGDWEGRFALVTAFDVFYHIIDPLRFRTAIANVRRVMAPDAYFLISDAFGDETFAPEEHVVFRSLDLYRKAFQANGLQVEHIEPVTVFLNSPLNSSGVTGKLMKLLYYGITTRLTSKPEADGLLERLWLGTLFQLEAPLLTMLPTCGRSNRLLVARRVG